MIAVAWDVDGTLVDSEPLHLHALQMVCRANGVDLADFGPTPFVGVAINKVWQQLAPRFGGTPDAADERRREIAFRTAVSLNYRASAHALQARPGAVACVRRLAARGVRQCAVSSSERDIVEANLQAIGLHEAFEFLITLDEVEHAKPDPEPYQRAVVQLGLPAAAVWAVEDSYSGLASALAAGLPTVLVTDTPAAAKAWGLDATRVLTSLLELGDHWPSGAVPIPSGADRMTLPYDLIARHNEPHNAGGGR